MPAVDRLVAGVSNATTLKQSILSHHTSAEDAGRVAQAAEVKTLVLSHLVPAEDPEVTEQMWIDAARVHFRGRVIVVKYGGNAMVDPALATSFAEDVVLMHSVGIRPVRANQAVKTRAAVARRAIVVRDRPIVCCFASQLRKVRRSRSETSVPPSRAAWSSRPATSGM